MANRHRAALAATAILCAVGSSLRADESYFVVRGSSWRYFRGLQEASPAEVSAWRQVEFDDSAWAVGSAPFGYGDPELGTDLSQQLPPMRNNYTCVFLRRLFEITDPAQVGALHANVDYDDGFVLWINGVEVVRDRVGQQSGDPVAFDAVAEFSHSAGAFENFDLPDPDGYLRAGINVVAVQAFNISLTSTDFLIDVELLDPFGPDLTPPAVEKIVPAPGTVVRSLDRISISFSEAVTGVSAADLLVGGQPASTLAGLGAGPYDFGFPPLPDGLVAVAWAAGHGIRDLGVPPNPFGGAPPWSYTVDSTLPAAELVVSEILAVNREGLLDEDGEASDWIEILNRGSIAVDLAGWSLSDDPRDPSRWTFPSRILGPGQYLVVFASGKDRRPAVGELHASFRLSSGGEYLALSSAESPPEVAFEYAPRFPEQRPDVSYGLDDSGALVFFTTPTPGGPNTSPTALGIVPEPVISVPRGFFDEPFLTDIGFSGADTVVFYTLDGAEPGPSSGQRYSVPIAIAGTAQRAVVTLRAAAYRPGYLPSRTVTATYIFPRHVLTQPALPAGFPSTWPGTTADYGFDARVINAAGNADLAIEGLLSIPTLSVVSDMANLFDPSTGNLMRPSMEGPAWERPVSAELILPDGKAGFQIDCGLRVQGGSSTSGWKSKKISLRLLFKGDYGSTKLRYRFFPDSPVERFDSIVLDAHLNLAWTHPDHGQRVRSQYVRDAFVSDLQLAAGSYAPHSRFVNLYINGLHWGIYDVHERPDASFAAEYFGGEKEDYDAMRHNTSTVVDGSSLAYSQMLAAARANLQNADSYQSLQQYLDVQDFADYMIVNLYAGNTDWAHQNWYATRLRAPGAAYRYHSWDAEHVLKSVTENVTGKNDSGGPTEVFQRLCANTDFRRLFGDRVQRLFFGSGALRVDPESPDWDEDHPERNRPAEIYMTRIREVDAAMVIESARWGDAQRPSQPYTRENEWMQELQWMLTQYFPRRSGIVLSQLRARSLYPQIAAPELSVPGGIVAPGFELSLSLPAAADGSIYYTTDGRDPRHEGTGGVAASALEYSTPLTIEDHTRVRARTLSGVDWSALTEAVFSVTDPRTSIRISEILYHAPEGSEHDFLELVNTAAATVDISGLRFTAGIDFSFPEGTTLGAGEYIVLASDPTAFAARYPGVPIGGVFISGSLENAGERITIEDSRGRTVDSVEYDDEGFWPIGPDGFGFSLVRAHLGSDPDDPASWRASRHRGGSPGQADPQPLHGGVVINEVLSYSRGALEDAVELFNESAAPIDIGGWYLSDSRADEEKLKKYRIPDGTVIAAGGFAVFYEHELNADPDSELSFALSSSGDDIYLSSADASGELTGHIAGHEFDAAFEGISFGVHATSTGLDFTALAERTFGRDQPATVEEFRLG
ncbi:MAG: lamin tail domain-containing protein, partial [Planctomycetes bacterium]|nr:lamin tail domain-containing protein [Planctomycetota bacterium]